MNEAIIITTYLLSNDELNKIKEKIPQLKNFAVKNIIDKGILGGMVIKFADKIIDLSLKNKLKMISQKLYEQL
ncbi:MAG: F0F1 ATP synthase subunit delta [Microgenomates group bacterium]